MGTRCLTVFKDEEGKEICVLYRQFDGYPDGHGKELKEFLANKAVINGYGDEDVKKGNFNGMGCLAAQVIAHFKKGIGGFYLYPAGTRGEGEEWVYVVSLTKKGRIKIKQYEADGWRNEYTEEVNKRIQEVQI